MLRREWTDDPRLRVVFSSVPLPFSGLFVSRTRQRGTITHTGGRAGSESIGKSSHRIPTTIIIIRGWWWTAAAAATPPGECVKTARRTLGVTQHRQVIAQIRDPRIKQVSIIIIINARLCTGSFFLRRRTLLEVHDTKEKKRFQDVCARSPWSGSLKRFAALHIQGVNFFSSLGGSVFY